MNRKKSLLASTNGLKIGKYFAERNRSFFDLIKGDTVTSSNAAESGTLISDAANSKPAKVAVTSALIGNSTLLIVMKSSLVTFMALLLCTTLSAILGNIAYYLWNKARFSKKQANLFEELVLKYYEVEDTLTESLSDDVRLAKAAMMYRRDLRDVIILMGKDMGYKKNTLITRSFSDKSLRQLNSSINAEVEAKLPDLFNTFKSEGFLTCVSGDKAIYFVSTDSALSSLRAANKQIDEILSAYGLKAYFVREG